MPGIWAGVLAGRGQGQSAEEMLPAGGVDGCLVGGEAAVDQAQAGAGGVGVRVNSTWVAPGGRAGLPATPQLTSTRRGGSSSR
jgi:hypothetical protein